MSCGLAIAALVTGCVVLFCIAHAAILRRNAMQKKLLKTEEKLSRLTVEKALDKIEIASLRKRLERFSPHV
jgi:hypothetical protein